VNCIAKDLHVPEPEFGRVVMALVAKSPQPLRGASAVNRNHADARLHGTLAELARIDSGCCSEGAGGVIVLGKQVSRR